MGCGANITYGANSFLKVALPTKAHGPERAMQRNMQCIVKVTLVKLLQDLMIALELFIKCEISNHILCDTATCYLIHKIHTKTNKNHNHLDHIILTKV